MSLRLFDVWCYEEKEEIQDYEMQIVNCNFWLRFEPLLQDSSMIYQLPDRTQTTAAEGAQDPKPEINISFTPDLQQ